MTDPNEALTKELAEALYTIHRREWAAANAVLTDRHKVFDEFVNQQNPRQYRFRKRLVDDRRLLRRYRTVRSRLPRCAGPRRFACGGRTLGLANANLTAILS